MAPSTRVLLMAFAFVIFTIAPSSMAQPAATLGDEESMAQPAAAPGDEEFYEDALAPSPIDAYLERCVAKLSDICGPEVFEGVFGNITITEACCKNLVQVGKPCHDQLVRRIIDIPWIRRQVDQSQVLAQSEDVWNKCVKFDLAVGSPAQSPMSA